MLARLPGLSPHRHSTPRLSRQRSARPATRVRFWNLTLTFLPPSASHFEHSRLLKPQRVRLAGLEGVAGPERSPASITRSSSASGPPPPAHQGATCWEKLRHGALCKGLLVSLPRLPPSRKTSVFCSWLGTSCAWSLRPWGTAVLGVLCVPVQLSHEAHSSSCFNFYRMMTSVTLYLLSPKTSALPSSHPDLPSRHPER